jgi:malate dehydrogenase (oxaloacetate-decarboxylating)
MAIDIVRHDLATIVRDLVVFCSSEDGMVAVETASRRVEGVEILEVEDRTFALHRGGKLTIEGRAVLADKDDLAMAYTPGVARVCDAIAADPDLSHRYTMRANTVGVVSDGSAVLGLGNIGAVAALPVMEGKAALFKAFAGVDAVPVVLDVGSTEELISTVASMSPMFGGINLEDIAAPRCFEVEARLQELLDIPVFHDDQHGTAVVVLAALRNALRLVGKRRADVRVVLSGAGAAGVAITRILKSSGMNDLVAADRQGAIHRGRSGLDPSKQWLADHSNPEGRTGTLSELLAGADVFIGVSGPGLLTRLDVESMADAPIVFALANPVPEIMPEEVAGAAAVMATGRSDYPNQINNVLCFPGMFRGALDVGATRITEPMKMAAADAIANAVPSDELQPGAIVPSVFLPGIAYAVADAVANAARDEGVTRQDPSRT